MKKILTIIPYKFYPPMGGGALRCFNLLLEMAKKNTVYVLTEQTENDFMIDGKTILPENINIISLANYPRYKTIFNLFPSRIANGLNYRFIRRSLRGSANLFLLSAYTVLKQLLKDHKFDIIFFENLESVGMTSSIFRRKSPNSLLVYDAHNVDSELWLRNNDQSSEKMFRFYAKVALHTEQRLFKKVDYFFCCSEEDKTKLQKLNKNRIDGTVIANGVDIISRKFDDNIEKYNLNEILFCGSLDYFPNKEGLLWFYKDIFPIIKISLPNMKLTVIGKVSGTKDYESFINDPEVNFIGEVESVLPFYKRSCLSIVPLNHGSGTRLKILEAMSMGCPVVSTTIGAEGIDCQEGKHLLIANDSHEFSEQIISILKDPSRYNSIRKNALELVRDKYDWKVIGEKVNQLIKYLLLKME